MNSPPKTNLTITKRATITMQGAASPRELANELLALDEEWQDGKMSFEVSRDQRDGNWTRIVIDAR